jgi:hypothetical protein
MGRIWDLRLLRRWTHGEGPRSRCYGRTTALRLFVQPYDEDEDEQFFFQVFQVMEHRWNEIDRGKPTTRKKTCPSATLSTTNPTWTDPGSNPGLRSERPETNRLSHGTAEVVKFDSIIFSVMTPCFPVCGYRRFGETYCCVDLVFISTHQNSRSCKTGIVYGVKITLLDYCKNKEMKEPPPPKKRIK